MTIINIISFLVAGFLGYIAGRLGDYFNDVWLNDPSWTPHHWIYGFLLMAIALLFFKNSLELWIFAFGLGIFVSDLKDFLSFKLIGKENKIKGQRKFWHIN